MKRKKVHLDDPKYWFDIVSGCKDYIKEHFTKQERSYLKTFKKFESVCNSSSPEHLKFLLKFRKLFFQNVYSNCREFDIHEHTEMDDLLAERKKIQNKILSQELSPNLTEKRESRMKRYCHFFQKIEPGGGKVTKSKKGSKDKKLKHPMFPKDPQKSDLYLNLERILNELVRNDRSWPFLEPVDSSQVIGYLKIIKNPIDLSTMRNKLRNRKYENLNEFEDDLKLMFSNCRKFNIDEGNIFVEHGNELEQLSNRLLEEYQADRKVALDDIKFVDWKKEEEDIITLQKKLEEIDESIAKKQKKEEKKLEFEEMDALVPDEELMGHFFLNNYHVCLKGDDKVIESNIEEGDKNVLLENKQLSYNDLKEPDIYENSMLFLTSSIPCLEKKFVDNHMKGGVFIANRYLSQMNIEQEKKIEKFDIKGKRHSDYIKTYNDINEMRGLRKSINERREYDESIENETKIEINEDLETNFEPKSEKQNIAMKRAILSLFLGSQGFENVKADCLDILTEIVQEYIDRVCKMLNDRISMNYLNIPFEIVMLQVLQSCGLNENVMDLLKNFKKEQEEEKQTIDEVKKKLRRICESKKRGRNTVINEFENEFKVRKI